MDSFDLITALDATIDGLVEPLLTRQPPANPTPGNKPSTSASTSSTEAAP